MNRGGPPLKNFSTLSGEPRPPLKGIRGWLIIPLIGLLVTPIRLVLFLLKDLAPLFAQGSWHALTTPGSDAYHPLLAPLIIFECVGNILFVIFSVVLVVLFFRKSGLLPKLMVAYLILNLFFVAGDFFFVNLIPGGAEQSGLESAKELARSIIGAVIWVPYFLVSKRVKQTFGNQETTPSEFPGAL